MTRNYQYVEEVSDECEKCGMKSNEYRNIGLWNNKSNINPDKTLCLNCVLEQNISAPDIEELLFEGEYDIHEENYSIIVSVETIVGVTMHIFPIEKRSEKCTDPGPDLTSAGPAVSPKEYDVIKLWSKKAMIETVKPRKDKVEYTSNYHYKKVKKYLN